VHAAANAARSARTAPVANGRRPSDILTEPEFPGMLAAMGSQMARRVSNPEKASGRMSLRAALAAVAVAASAAVLVAWGLSSDPSSLQSAQPRPSQPDPAASAQPAATFASRFAFGPPAPSDGPNIEAQIARARKQLADAMQPQQTPAPEAKGSVVASAKVPLPRTRPPTSNLIASMAPAGADPRPSSDPLSNVSAALRKAFAMLQQPGVLLASAAPDGGVSGNGQDEPLSTTDKQTALYDISARVVYMPDGTKLEAHSGFGDLLDDPRYIHVHDRGATPPQVYDLTLREKLFHGVEALRMKPVGEGDLHGRNGLLAHSYMLGPNGDSNGCVSFKDYPAFLKAFKNGDVKRLVVVPSLADKPTATAQKT
jgi:hypothetical protein